MGPSAGQSKEDRGHCKSLETTSANSRTAQGPRELQGGRGPGMPKSPTRALPSTPQGASSNAPSLPLAVATDLSGRDSEWLDQRQE